MDGIDLRHLTYRTARRIAVAVGGVTLLLLGAVLLFVPGPGVVILGLGLAVLAAEFAWARRWLARIRSAADGAIRTLRGDAAESDAPERDDATDPPGAASP